tara:strand:- start:1124 stop:1411 length:288 start_codon:yes stop_codon:yes gene_type:complete
LKKDNQYLIEVRSHPCLICERTGVDAHHLRPSVTGIKRGLGQKASGDDMAVPLCRFHHAESHSHGYEEDFWVGWGVDPVRWAMRSWRRWNQKRSQ